MARTHGKLSGSIIDRRAVVVDMTHKNTTRIAKQLSPFPLDSPIVSCLKEGHQLCLFLLPELALIDCAERECPFIACLEVEIRRKQVCGAQIQGSSTFSTSVGCFAHGSEFKGLVAAARLLRNVGRASVERVVEYKLAS